MRVRAVIASIAACLLIVSCTSDPDAGPASTTSPETTGTTSLEPFDIDDYPIPPGTLCFYLRGYVSVPADQLDNAVAVLNAGGIASDPASIEAVLNATALGEQPPGTENIAAELGEVLGVLAIPNDDPYQVALGLRDRGYRASPIHVAGQTGHVRFKPGTDPTPISGYELPQPRARWSGDKIVAVVDSGIVPPDPGNPIPRWMFDGDGDSANDPVRYDQFDEEQLSPTNPAGHGTFITGLIRQIAPSATVTMAAARQVNTDAQIIVEQGEAVPGDVVLSSELHVAEAIQRLINRHGDDVEEMSALNLSLGAFACDPTQDGDLVTIHATIDKWLREFSESQVFAAAGNENYRSSGSAAMAAGEYVPFWPAARSLTNNGVHGVAAVGSTGTETVWSSNAETPIDDPPGRPWVTDLAPGAHLVSLAGGRNDDPDLGEIPDLVCWSGSSFATAVASAQFAIGVTPSNPAYDTIDGLTYIDPATDLMVTVGSGLDPVPTGGCAP